MPDMAALEMVIVVELDSSCAGGLLVVTWLRQNLSKIHLAQVVGSLQQMSLHGSQVTVSHDGYLSQNSGSLHLLASSSSSHARAFIARNRIHIPVIAHLSCLSISIKIWSMIQMFVSGLTR